MPVTMEVHSDDAGQRADRFLRKLLQRAPLSFIHRLLRQGAVRVDGAKIDGAHRLEAGVQLELRVDEARFAALTGADEITDRPDASALSVVYEDDHLLVVDKPGGLAVHGGTGLRDDHLVARIRAHLGASEARTFRPAPAHRIDRATSGLVLVGKTAASLRSLSAAFREHRIIKTYLAVVHGKPSPRAGTVERPLAIQDDGDPREPKATPDDEGSFARTRYRTRRTRQGLSIVEIEIDTGRTHQVRAHLTGLSCPIVGDRRYGAPDRPSLSGHRIALHAWRLALDHPIDERRLDLRASPPAEFDELLDQRGSSATANSQASRRKPAP